MENAVYILKQRGLVQQVGYTPRDLAKLTWGLRFTPSVCLVGALVGLATQTLWIHFGRAVLGIMALGLPAHHPIDLLYNHGVRHILGGPRLPPIPFPRGIAYFLGGCMNLGIGLSFQAGQLVPAYLLGLSLIILQIIVISGRFCAASWLFEGMAARRFPRIGSEEAHRLVAEEDALLVDVRSAEEYAMGYLPGAVNIPVREIERRKNELHGQGRPLLLYCTAGFQCHKAAEILRSAGVEDVHELGSMKQWGNMTPSWS